MLDWTTCRAVERVAGKVGGIWLFKDTRVPVRALFENLRHGATVAEFLEWFPGVTREQVQAVLAHTKACLTGQYGTVDVRFGAVSCVGAILAMMQNHQ